MTSAQPSQPVGSLATEATLLLDALAAKLSEWQRPDAGADQGLGAAGTGTDPGSARSCPECGHDPAAPCTGCPVCKLLALVRGQRPEAAAKLLDAAGLVISALRSLLPDPAEPGEMAQTRPDTGKDGGVGRPPGVQRIDIR